MAEVPQAFGKNSISGRDSSLSIWFPIHSSTITPNINFSFIGFSIWYCITWGPF